MKPALVLFKLCQGLDRHEAAWVRNLARVVLELIGGLKVEILRVNNVDWVQLSRLQRSLYLCGFKFNQTAHHPHFRLKCIHYLVSESKFLVDEQDELLDLVLGNLLLVDEFQQLLLFSLDCLLSLNDQGYLLHLGLALLETHFDADGGVTHIMDHHEKETLVPLQFGLQLLDGLRAEVLDGTDVTELVRLV